MVLVITHLRTRQGLSASQSLTFQPMPQLIFLHFLLTNESQQATTVRDNPVYVLKAQAQNMIQEQGSVLFSVKYFAAEMLMCPDHHVPCSSLTQCFLSFHWQ